jgi:putative peptide zinc metalloprotease protein
VSKIAADSRDGTAGSSVEVPERPALASGIELVGELQGTGFVESQWLVKRGDRFLQLTELLYRVAEQANGERTLEEIAVGVTEAGDRLVTAENVGQIVGMLIPAGIIAAGDESPAVAQAIREREARPSPLGLGLRMRVVGPRVIDPIASVLQYLFAPPVLVAVLVTAVLAHVWMYAERGLTAAFIDALYTPSFLLVVLAVILTAAVFHEFGHAAALRYGGGRARGMGMGVYLVFPAFYTDVTDSYRLGRWARVRTGLGGAYFHLLFALGLIGAAVAFGYEFLLIAVLLINLEIARQFIPFARLDGYWVLADLTGVPDFFSQIGPFVRSRFPRLGPGGTRLPRLKRWVEAVFAAYIVITIPLLIVLLALLVKVLPRFVTALWDAIKTQAAFLSAGLADGDAIGAATAAAGLLILGLPALGIAYLLYTLTWRPLRAVLRQPTPARRAAGLAAVTVIIGILAVVWAPRLPFAADAAPVGVQTFDVSERGHVEGAVAYPQRPPVGGRHSSAWQNCGFYTAPIRDEQGVHSLEHGAVWITYRPGLSGRHLDRLRELAREPYVLVTPYQGLGGPVVASSWGRRLRLRSADDARLERFVGAFRLSSAAPESGGACTGGVGTPE